MSGCAEHEPFALQVTDHSMEPEFPAGCVVIVEPVKSATSGQYVICRIDDEYIFRELVIDDNRYVLRALQVGMDDIVLDRPPQLVGRVVRRSGRRRKDARVYL